MVKAGASWCDLVKHADGRVEFVSLHGTTVICEHAETGAVRWAIDAGQPLLYLRAVADSEGRVCAIGQGHRDGGAWVVIEGLAAPIPVAITATPFPVAIMPTPGRTGWTLFVQVATDAYQRIVLTQSGDVLVRTGEPMAPTSQGFLYVTEGGVPITQDEGRTAILGLALPSPSLTGSLVWAGQSTSAATIALYDAATGVMQPLNTPGGQPPHIVESNGTYYVCSYVAGPAAWLSTHRRPFAVAPTEPVEDTSGQAIDPLLYMFGELPRRDGSHPMCWHVDHANQRWYEIKFANTSGDSWEAFYWTDTAIGLFEDRSQSEPTFNPPWDYAFTEDVWLTRPMRPGATIQHDGNRLIRFDPRNNQMVNLPGMPFRYETRLGKVYRSYPFGGAVGTRPAIEVEAYALGSPYFERHTYALNVGRCIWQAIDAKTGQELHKTTFTEIGGPALTPTVGGRDSNVWPPPAQRVGMTIINPTEYPASASGNRFRAVCGPNPGEHWASWVEWIYRRVDESTWTQQGERRNPQDDQDHTFTFPAAGEYEIGLRWGTGQTGRQRIVRVHGAAPVPQPPQPTPPPTSETMQIQTNDRQHFITVSPNGLATATQTSAEHATVQLTLVRSDDGRFSLRGPNGKVGSAQPDGTFTFDREKGSDWRPDGWEALRAERSPLGGESYVTDHGTRLRAVNQGGSELRHDPRDVPDIDETFWPSTPIVGGVATKPPVGGPLPDSGLDRIDGQLQVEGGGGFVVNGRPVLPTLCHYGDAFSRWTHGGRDEVLGWLDMMASGGYHGIRFWSTLGPGSDFWSGREVYEGGTPNYWGQLREFLTALRDRGLVCQISQGDLRQSVIPNRRAFAETMAQVVGEVGPHVVALFEGLNEAWQNGEPDPSRLAEFVGYFKARRPEVLVGLSSSPLEGQDEHNAWCIDPANVYIHHSFRGLHWNNKVEHIWSTPYEDRPRRRQGWQGEPAGPGDDVSASENKEELDDDALCAMAIAALMTRQAWVYFCGPGVRSNRHQRFDQMPGFHAVPKVRALLPVDVGRYQSIWHGGEGKPWSHLRVFGALPDTRCEHTYHDPDGRFVVLAYGKSSGQVPQLRNARIDRDIRFGNKARLIVGQAA